MAVGMWMEDEVNVELVAQHCRELRHAGGKGTPLLRRQLHRLGDVAVEVGVPLREQDQVPCTQCGQQRGFLPAVIHRLFQCLGTTVQAGEDSTAGQPKASLAELVTQLLGVGG
jgi:hypothetical protein